MKTEKQIRHAAKILGDCARKLSGDYGSHEEYEVCANFAMALDWVLGNLDAECDRRVRELILGAEAELADPRAN